MIVFCWTGMMYHGAWIKKRRVSLKSRAVPRSQSSNKTGTARQTGQNGSWAPMGAGQTWKRNETAIWTLLGC